jgi:DNA-binding HxlR family transcriptional regulator
MVKKHFNCPAEMTVSLIGGKWKAILLYNMRKGPKRFGELKRLSPGISQATLAKELKDLESNGIIRRFAMGRDPLAGVDAHQKEFVVGDFGMAVFQK